VEARDTQADLYQQACDYLNAGKPAQAVAALQELQQINPFYRDSATLLAQAKAALNGKPSATTSTSAGETSSSEIGGFLQSHRLLLFGSAGGVLVLLLVVIGLFGLPRLQATGVAQLDATATATAIVVPASATPVIPTEPPATATPIPATATTTPRVLAEQGALLYSDDFTIGGPGGWASMQGAGWTVGYVNNAYRVSAIAGPGHIWSYRTTFEADTDYSLGVDVQVLSGDAGMLMRYTNEQNYLAFFINPANGSYTLERRNAGAQQVISEGQSEAIKQGPNAVNRLVAHLQGNRVRLFINNQRVDSSRVDGLTPTNIYGVVVHARDVANAEAVFDNLEIRALERPE
jgi:hypothetical protein